MLPVQVTFEGAAWASVSADAKDMIKRLLDRDYNSRITAAEALHHPWILTQCGEEGCILEHDATSMVEHDLGGL